MSYATNEQYSTEKIMDLINNYPFYISHITMMRKKYNDDVGGGNIAQYGIESTLPKPQGSNTDPVFNEVQRLTKMDKELSRIERKARYIQNRWDRITDERLAIVFNLRLSGTTYQDIADALDVSKSRVSQMMNEICELLKD